MRKTNFAKQHSNKSTFLTSFVSLLLCISMLLGTTFAWFTDSVSSNNNIIASGNLDIELYHANNGTNGVDKPVDGSTKLFDDVDSDLWEPGAMVWEKFTVANEGSLNLKYEFTLNARNATVVDGVSFASMLKVAIVDENFVYTRENVQALTSFTSLESFTLPGDLTAGENDVFGIVIWWEPSANDNLFNMNNDRRGQEASIEVGVSLVATQYTGEFDSFDDNYDIGALFPKAKINLSEKKSVANQVSDSGQLAEPVFVGSEQRDLSASVPAGVQLADGTTELNLTVQTVSKSEANVEIDESIDEEVLSIDVHMDGVSEDNTIPMQITLRDFVRPGINDNSIRLYHVEDGQTIQMIAVPTLADLDEHNEFYYNAVTGDLILSMATFSEVTVVANEHWDGKSATAFAGGSGTQAEPYLIANASQLAYFRDIVDGKVESWTGDTTFAGKFVKLSCDVILNHHDETANQFDPIGWGYDNSAYNAGGAAGKVFMGTFDGAGHAIHGLWQNGWDLEANTKTDYTYTNCGFGLFGAVKDATIKNLTLKHSNVVVECVEAGILVGLAQGNCTFENIYIYHASIANYQRPAGGVVGEVSPRFENGVAQDSIMNFNNVHVGSSVTVGTLWGDFDAPVGGVIGAYWDDSGKTKINMTHVDVSCKLDVYNDVTSAYQWYAYRRAGMLIGNTDRATTDADGRTVATAPYLTCDGCIVIYDYTWTDYAYCEFTNQNNVTESGFNAYNYPWVRVQPSLYNSAYSNPRYGHPVDAAGNIVDDDLHIHDADDDCTVILPFNQLYGGGQGVYGQPNHEGVEFGKFTITFIGGDGHIEDVWYITGDEMANGNQTIKQLADNNIDNKHKIPDVTNGNKTLLAWEDANGTKYATYENGEWKYNTKINKENLVDIVLYPEWSNEYNVYFLNHDGKVLHYETFDTGNNHSLDTTAIANALASVQQQVDSTGKVIQATWDKDINSLGFTTATDDIVVRVKLNISSDSITLTPKYDPNTGVLIEYWVTGVKNSSSNTSISIPGYVGNIPVTKIDDDAFGGFNDLAAVRIPNTMTSLADGIFPGKLGWISLFDDRQQITIYFEGSYDEWVALTQTDATGAWDDTLGDGSRIFFLKTEGGREIVDLNAGFMELYKKNGYTWIYHNHPHLKNPPSDCKETGHYKNFTDYDASGRPDRNYWIDDSGNSIVNDDGSAKTTN